MAEDTLTASVPEFIRRMTDPNAPHRMNPDGTFSTHLMRHDLVDERWIAYPSLIHKEGKLVEMNQPDALKDALENKNFKEFPDEAAAASFASGSWKPDVPHTAPEPPKQITPPPGFVLEDEAPPRNPYEGLSVEKVGPAAKKMFLFAAQNELSIETVEAHTATKEGKTGWVGNLYIARLPAEADETRQRDPFTPDPDIVPHIAKMNELVNASTPYFGEKFEDVALEQIDWGAAGKRFVESFTTGFMNTFVEPWISSTQGDEILESYWQGELLQRRLDGRAPPVQDTSDPHWVMSEWIRLHRKEPERARRQIGGKIRLELMPGFRQARAIALSEMAPFRQSAPKSTPEALADVAGSLAIAIPKILLLKKVGRAVGMSPFAASAAAVELSGGRAGTGEGVALVGAMTAIEKLPITGQWAPVLKTLAASGVFAGVAAARGAEARDIVISGFIPIAFKGTAIWKYFRGQLANASTTAQQKAVLLELSTAKTDLAKGVPSRRALDILQGRPTRAAIGMEAAPKQVTGKPPAELLPPIELAPGREAAAVLLKAIQTLQANKPAQEQARRKLAALQTKAKAKRISRYERLYDEGIKKGLSPQKANTEARKALAGELVPGAEVPESLRPQLTTPQWRQLFQLVGKRFSGYRRLRAFDALSKVRDGGVLQPNEIDLMYEAFGPDLAQALSSQAGLTERLLEAGVELSSIPRTLMAAGDISATGRQILPVLWKDVGDALFGRGLQFRWAKASGRGLGAFLNKKFADKTMAQIRHDPLFREFSKEWGISFTDVGSGTMLGDRPEGFASRWLQKVPLIRHSARAMVVAGNSARLDLAKSIRKHLMARGVEITPKLAKDMGSYISDLTGRARIPEGKLVREAAGAANRIMFSPRFALATAKNVTTGFHTLSRDPHVRAEGWRTLAGSVVTTAGVVGTAYLFGADVEVDPRSSDFLKIKVGDTRVDVTAGHARVARFLFQMAVAQKKSAAGHIEEAARMDLIWAFIRSKGSPAIGIARTLVTGRDYFGTPVEGWGGVMKTVYENMTFLWLQEGIAATRLALEEDEGMAGAMFKGAVASGTEWVGMSTLTYPESARIKLLKLQDELSQEKFGKQYFNLSPAQQMVVRMENEEALALGNLQVQVDNAAMKRDKIDVTKSRAAGRSVINRLSPEVQEIFQEAGVQLHLSPSNDLWKLNWSSKWFKRYQEILAEDMDIAMKELIAFPAWKNVRPDIRRDVILQRFRDGRRTAQYKTITERGND